MLNSLSLYLVFCKGEVVKMSYCNRESHWSDCIGNANCYPTAVFGIFLHGIAWIRFLVLIH